MLIHIFYSRIINRLEVEAFNFYLDQLPKDLQSKILRYRKWQDSHRSLLGKLLLKKALEFMRCSNYSLSDLKFTKLERPYFDNSIDFNISHSGEYVVCAICRNCKIGIDVEEIKEIPLDDFTDNFSPREWADILSSNDRLHRFYTYWTQKEAFLKAIGVGLNVPLNKTEVLNNTIIWNDTEWFVQQVPLDGNYVSFVSSRIFAPAIEMQKIEF